MTSKSILLNAFFSTAREDPNRIAIFHKNEKVTYGKLSEHVERLGHFIRNIENPGPVAIHLNRTPYLIAALFGCWHSGRAFIALDPTHPIERKKKILTDSKPSLVITDRPLGLSKEVNIHDLRLSKIKQNENPIKETNLAYIL
ncbi:MAG: AMP-binding protein, partial [Waddliaceae bacterium]